MRVALVCGAFQPTLDGVADYTARLVSELETAGVSAAVLSAGDGHAPPGVELHRVARRCYLRGVQAVARAVDQLEPDLVHVQFAPSSYGFSAAIALLPASWLVRARSSRPCTVWLVGVAPEDDARNRAEAGVVGGRAAGRVGSRVAAACGARLRGRGRL